MNHPCCCVIMERILLQGPSRCHHLSVHDDDALQLSQTWLHPGVYLNFKKQRTERKQVKEDTDDNDNNNARDVAAGGRIRIPGRLDHRYLAHILDLQAELAMGRDRQTGRIFEVTRKGRIVWEYAPEWITGGGFAGSVYRAYRIPKHWLPKHRQCPAE